MDIKKQLVGIGSAFAIAAGLLGATVATAPAAAAATPTCTTWDGLNAAPSWRALMPVTSGYSYNCVLAQGNTGADVTALQYSLRRCYDRTLVADGVYGPHTARVVRSAQAAAGITADGIYGPQTRAHMLWMWENLNTGSVVCARISEI